MSEPTQSAAEKPTYEARVIELFSSWLDHWSIKVNRKIHEVYGAWDECRERAQKEVDSRHSGQAVDRQEKWTPRKVALLYIKGGNSEVSDVINATLAAERQRTEQYKAGSQENYRMWQETRQQLLSAQVTIEKIWAACDNKGSVGIYDAIQASRNLDLSLLHQHDAELLASVGWHQDSDSLWNCPSLHLHGREKPVPFDLKLHDAEVLQDQADRSEAYWRDKFNVEVRKPLVDLIVDPDNPLGEFERIGNWYYKETGFLRPGKSEPIETGRDSNSKENRQRFSDWWDAKKRDALAKVKESK